MDRIQDKYNQDIYKGENQNCSYWPIIGSYKNWQIIHCIDSRKTWSTYTGINIHINQNTIRNIALNIGKDISDRNYGSVSKFETMQKLDIILLNGKVTVILYIILIRQEDMLSRLVSWWLMQYILIHLLFSKQWCNTYEKKQRKCFVRLNTVIWTKVRAQSINDVAIHAIASNKLRGAEIMLSAVYVCDITHDEILKTIFSRE